ncbi:MAG: hypothetical protein H7Y06_08785 [Opitutaceae bacterium]|nr:hypothetical protein [Opitutaceae bacterium]
MSKLLNSTILLALLALLGLGLWVLIPSYSTDPVPVSEKPAARMVQPAGFTTTATTPATSHNLPVVETKSAASALSISNLIGSPTLDEKTVMSGLARITLETDRSLDERSEALGHLLNLSAEDPAPVLLPLIANRDLPDTLCDRILDDSLNAPPSWQADACLAVLTHRKNKALKTRAHTHLAFLLGSDHGSDLAAWTKAVALEKEPPAP